MAAFVFGGLMLQQLDRAPAETTDPRRNSLKNYERSPLPMRFTVSVQRSCRAPSRAPSSGGNFFDPKVGAHRTAFRSRLNGKHFCGTSAGVFESLPAGSLSI